MKLWGDNYKNNYQILEQAVVDTRMECLYYNDILCETYFHAVSAGQTRNGSEFFGPGQYEYLSSVDCKKDLLAENYVTIKTFTQEEIRAVVGQWGVEHLPQNPVELFEITGKDDNGYVQWVNVSGQAVQGEVFRKELQLPSSAFQVEAWEDGVRFVCKGLGHGLGMSLYTANELAKEGKNYKEIIDYFYKNVTIQ